MSNWQPIETAPKDGTKIDVWCPGYGRIADARFVEGRWREWGINECDQMTWVQIGDRITHWMPLPEPPKEDA